MDFIKRNVGLIVFSVLAIAVAGFLVVGIRKKAGEAKEYEEMVKQQKKYMEEVSAKSFSLTEDNLEIAKENHETARKKLVELRQWLYTRFSVPAETRTTNVECVRKLKDEVLRMHKLLRDKEIRVGSGANYFSFENKATVLPSESEVPIILKQLRIIKEIVRIAAASYLLEVTDIRRVTDTNMAKKDMYTVMPIKMVVVGEMKTIQRFINQLQMESNCMFALRYVSFQALDQVKDSGISTGGGMGGGMDMGMGGMGGGMDMGMGGMGGGMDMGMGGMGGGMDMGMGGMGMGMGGMGAAGGMGGMGAGGMGGGMDMGGMGAGGMDMGMGGGMDMGGMGPDGMGGNNRGRQRPRRPMVVDRETQVIFQPHVVTAEIHIDFIEFLKPNEES